MRSICCCVFGENPDEKKIEKAKRIIQTEHKKRKKKGRSNNPCQGKYLSFQILTVVEVEEENEK